MKEHGGILILGAGGHGRVLAEALVGSGHAVAGFLDDDPAKRGLRLLGLEVLGGLDLLDRLDPARTMLVNGLGSVRDMEPRRRMFETLKARGFRFQTVTHASAVVAGDATVGEGAQILSGAVVVTGAQIGENAILNTRASVDHDCRIGAHAHLAPGVTLSGGVRVGEATHVGTGATVVQGIFIGAGCLVAAGAVVVRNVPDGARVQGVPGKILE